MIQLKISLYRHFLAKHEHLQLGPKHHGIWVEKGCLQICGTSVNCGECFFIDRGVLNEITCNTPSSFLHFEIGPSDQISDDTNGQKLLLNADFELTNGEAIVRMDQVSFPPGSCAYLHVHPGPGIRYLTKGSLEIVAEDHATLMKVGDAWYEDANSPVQANASTSEPSQFIRTLVLPPEYEGLPTIEYLNIEDTAKPRLQTNNRFFDRRVQF